MFNIRPDNKFVSEFPFYITWYVSQFLAQQKKKKTITCGLITTINLIKISTNKFSFTAIQ